MKIDSKIPFPGDLEPGRVGGKSAATPSKAGSPASGVSSPSSEDTFRLSSAHGELQSLTAALAHVPEVRVAQVEALHQQVRSGQYQPESGKIADALIAEQRKSFKA